MANISALTTPGYGKELIDKINEIIDWINGVTDADRVTDIQVNGTNLVITYINGDSDTLPLQDTTYGMATTEANGLMDAHDVFHIGILAEEVSVLNTACSAIEKANEAIDNIPPPYEPPDSGGDGDGGDGE